MAWTTSGMYKTAVASLTNGTIDWDADTITAQLTTSSYDPDFDTHDFRDDVTAYKATYATGDVEITGKTYAYDTVNNYVYLDCTATITFTTVTAGTCRGIVVYKNRGGASSADDLVCAIKFASDVTANGSDIQVTLNTNGICRITYTDA